MADFLSQEEIDALLDVCDEYESKEYGIRYLMGTTSEELQEVKIGSQGYITNNKQTLFVTILAIDKSNRIAVLIDNNFNPIKIGVTELSPGFYKTKDRSGAFEIKEMFDDISKILNDKMNINFNDFVTAVKSAKNAYPEIWM